MLVSFHSDAGNFIMFADDAKQLLRMMGHSGTIPGAVLSADVPAALKRLERSLHAGVPVREDAPEAEAEEDERDIPVSLKNRAFPLLEMLRHAREQQCNIMWDRA